MTATPRYNTRTAAQTGRVGGDSTETVSGHTAAVWCAQCSAPIYPDQRADRVEHRDGTTWLLHAGGCPTPDPLTETTTA